MPRVAVMSLFEINPETCPVRRSVARLNFRDAGMLDVETAKFIFKASRLSPRGKGSSLGVTHHLLVALVPFQGLAHRGPAHAQALGQSGVVQWIAGRISRVSNC